MNCKSNKIKNQVEATNRSLLFLKLPAVEEVFSEFFGANRKAVLANSKMLYCNILQFAPLRFINEKVNSKSSMKYCNWNQFTDTSGVNTFNS